MLAASFELSDETAPWHEIVSVNGGGPCVAERLPCPLSDATDLDTTLISPLMIPRESRSGPCDEAARLDRRPLQAESGRNDNMSDWKVHYRDDLDRDRTSRSVPSEEAALRRARHLHLRESAEIYTIVGPDGRTLAKEDIMRWVASNRR